MNVITTPRLSRRDWLRRSAAATLALGLWPGCARFGDVGRGDDFSFVVLNDTHFTSAKCPAWFERVTASLRALPVRPEFCLVAGDLAERGTESELAPMREVLRRFGVPSHVVIGNHDYTSQTDRAAYEKIFPKSLNYHFTHRGWQVVALDSSEGLKYQGTTVQPATLQWVDDTVPKLSRRAPTILVTHFPLGPGTPMRPTNADALLERLRDLNLVAVFNGHHHGFTERTVGNAMFTTNKCCAISRGNHDKTTEKGYFLCRARGGRIERQFVEVKPA